MSFRGRFAPSPTGRMHLGNVRSALLGWLQARAAGGQFLLRIEDLDRARCRPRFVDDLFRDLEWLGLAWDEPPLFQSQRDDGLPRGAGAPGRAGPRLPVLLHARGDRPRRERPPRLSDEGPRYPGTCARLTPWSRRARPDARARAALPRPRGRGALRGRAARAAPPGRGGGGGRLRGAPQRRGGELPARGGGGRRGERLTDVLRGDDLLSSTPRQLQLYEALGRPPRVLRTCPWCSARTASGWPSARAPSRSRSCASGACQPSGCSACWRHGAGSPTENRRRRARWSIHSRFQRAVSNAGPGRAGRARTKPGVGMKPGWILIGGVGRGLRADSRARLLGHSRHLGSPRRGPPADQDPRRGDGDRGAPP